MEDHARAIPVLNIASFRSDENTPDARAFVEELRSVCHDHGFFSLTGHGITGNDDLQHLARQFFALPEPERLAIANVNSPQFRGFTPVGHEHTKGEPDRREQLDISRELPARPVDANEPAWMRLRGPNLWPLGLPALRPAVESWIEAMESLGRVVCRALARALDQSPNEFAPYFSPHPEVLVKIIHYPPVDAPARQGVGEHRDTGLVTFLLQDDTGGLQVRLGDEWVDVPTVPGAFVVNLGEMMQLLTHGYFAATVHRVVSPLARDRYSIAYFFNPKLEATLAPLTLPPALAADAPGGESDDAANPILANYGDNSLKVRLRSHPDVAQRHHADLLG